MSMAKAGFEPKTYGMVVQRSYYRATTSHRRQQFHSKGIKIKINRTTQSGNRKSTKLKDTLLTINKNKTKLLVNLITGHCLENNSVFENVLYSNHAAKPVEYFF